MYIHREECSCAGTRQNQTVFLKMGQPRPLLSFIFGLFKQTSLEFLQQKMCEKCPSSVLCRDLNPRPSENESPPITTRAGFYFENRYTFSLFRKCPSLA